jgi:hypothetical protein
MRNQRGGGINPATVPETGRERGLREEGEGCGTPGSKLYRYVMCISHASNE